MLEINIKINNVFTYMCMCTYIIYRCIYRYTDVHLYSMYVCTHTHTHTHPHAHTNIKARANIIPPFSVSRVSCSLFVKMCQIVVVALFQPQTSKPRGVFHFLPTPSPFSTAFTFFLFFIFYELLLNWLSTHCVARRSLCAEAECGRTRPSPAGFHGLLIIRP